MRVITRISACLAILLGPPAIGPAAAFGVDKLSAVLDASQSFKSVGEFMVFNDDSDDPVWVVAEAFKWDMDEKDRRKLTPTDEIRVYPGHARLAGRATNMFRVKYIKGAPPAGEGAYRIRFSSIRVPQQENTLTEDADLTEEIKVSNPVSLQFDVPVYVADLSSQSTMLEKVSAHLDDVDKNLIQVTNDGDRHFRITRMRIDGVVRPQGLGDVLAGKRMPLRVEGLAAIQKLELEISAYGQTRWILVEKTPS